VKTLTGTDTDRLDEEKRRGITIDLGFASMVLGKGVLASIVDVPGHEDFVRNMVAGATGVDVALLVVAADEGMMPQTLEHLAILELLGIKTGVVAVTKSDLADEDWLELIESDVNERLASSSIRWIGTVRTSVVTGQGRTELLESLASAAAAATEKSTRDLFRLPVDRVFSVAGAGTVVTGTAWSGSVAVGDQVRLLPGEHEARIRGVEVHGRSCDAALPGRRTALALAGLARHAVARGHVVVTNGAWRETSAIDVVVTLLPGARPLTQRSRVRLHLGTAEVMARVTPADQDIAPGGQGYARLRLESPLVCRWGDRAVLRSYSPVTTVGGCIVADPWPRLRPRRPNNLARKSAGDPAIRLEAFVRGAGTQGISPGDLPIRLGVSPDDLPALVEGMGNVVPAIGRLLSAQLLDDLRDRILRMLSEYHNKRPLEPGMPRDLLRQVLEDDALADHVLSVLEAERRIVLEGTTTRLSGFEARLSDAESSVGLEMLAAFDVAGYQGLSLQDLEEVLGEGVCKDLLEFYVRQGSVIRVAKGRYYGREALDRLLQVILREVRDAGGATPGQLKEKTGLTRKYLIPVLEWMDGKGLTRRDTDLRRLGHAGGAVLDTVDSG